MGVGDRRGAVCAVYAGRGFTDLHRLRNATTGDGDLVLLHHAGHHIFRVWISHQRHAALDAGLQLRDSAALFSDSAARGVSEGRGDGYTLAADGGHGRAGRGVADGGDFAVPQGAGLKKQREFLSGLEHRHRRF